MYAYINHFLCWHFNIYEHDKLNAPFRWALKKFYNLEAKCVTGGDERAKSVSSDQTSPSGL